jgi:hypothetical protein
MDEADVQIVPLAQPRPLTLQERELLDFLLDGPVDSPELRAQAATAVVNGVCSCGCPSIQLAVNEEAPRARLDRPTAAEGEQRPELPPIDELQFVDP